MNRHYGRRALGRVLGGLVALAAVTPTVAAPNGRPAAWTQAVEPFRIVGNVYYVGSRGLASYLIVSPAGDILLDGTLAENAPLIERNIARLGFRLGDVKVLVNSHAHSDHAGGLARLKQDTGAVMLASQGDRWSLEHGRHLGDNVFGAGSFPPVKVDRVVKDGEAIRLGGTVLTAYLTPGHTPGCTTWSLPVSEAGRRLQVVIPCSMTVAGNVLVGNRAYPNIATDYRTSFARWKAMKADVVLTNHPEVADVLGRRRRQLAGQPNAFVSRGELQRIAVAAQADFDREMAKQVGAKLRTGASQTAKGGRGG